MVEAGDGRFGGRREIGLRETGTVDRRERWVRARRVFARGSGRVWRVLRTFHGQHGVLSLSDHGDLRRPVVGDGNRGGGDGGGRRLRGSERRWPPSRRRAVTNPGTHVRAEGARVA